MATKKPTKKAGPAVKAKTVKAKKPVVKKVKAVAVKPKKLSAVTDKPFTKSQIEAAIAEHTGLTKKQASDALNALTEVVHAHLKKGAVGHVKINGLMNIKTVKKPARKARKGVNPFTGQEMMIKAKPAHKAVKVLALKPLKDMVE